MEVLGSIRTSISKALSGSIRLLMSCWSSSMSALEQQRATSGNESDRQTSKSASCAASAFWPAARIASRASRGSARCSSFVCVDTFFGPPKILNVVRGNVALNYDLFNPALGESPQKRLSAHIDVHIGIGASRAGQPFDFVGRLRNHVGGYRWNSAPPIRIIPDAVLLGTLDVASAVEASNDFAGSAYFSAADRPARFIADFHVDRRQPGISVQLSHG